MKRVLKYLIIVVVAAALIACLAGFMWLTRTTDGARRLLATISHQTGLDISAASVEGNLGETLRLTQLSIRWPQGEIVVEQARLSAFPLALLTGNLLLREVSLKNVSMTNNAPDAPPTLQWPKVSRFTAWFGGAVDRLDIDLLTYRRPEQTPLKLSGISASLDWRSGYLSAKNITVDSGFGSASGDIRAGFSRPGLDINVALTPSSPVGGMEFFRLTGNFLPAKRPEQIAGILRLTGGKKQQEAKPLWELSLNAALTSQGIPLRNVRLVRPEKKGEITADGLLTFEGTKPYLSLAARAKDIDWTSDFHVPAKLSGSLSLKGTVEKYSGLVSIANTGKTWQSIRLEGAFTGNDGSAKIDIAKGSVMNGSLDGSVNLDWREGLAADADLRGRNLDPAAFEKEWAGKINFDLTGRMLAAENKRPRGEISLIFKQSRLHGQSLNGDLRAAFEGADVVIQDLALQGKDFHLQASGIVKNKLDFTARIGDFSSLVPQTEGSLTARGWMRYSDGKIGGAISAGAKEFSAYGLSIASADIKASLDEGDQAPVSLQATLQKLVFKQFYADTLTLQAKGTKKNHEAFARLRAGQNEANLALTGSYHQKEWRGMLSKLEGRDKTGLWRLAQPSGVIVSSSGFTLDPLILSGDTETVRASGKLSYEPLSGTMSLDWSGVNLQRINDWFSQDNVTGYTQGSLRLNLLPDRHIEANAKASFQGAFNLQGKSVGIRQMLLTVEANEKGSQADLSLSLTEGGTLQGKFSSPAPAALNLPDDGRFSFRLQNFDSAILSRFLPKPVGIEGKMTAEAEGRLHKENRLTMTGHARALASKVRIRGQKSDIGIDLQEAALDWSWKDDALNGSVLLKLSEYGKLEGRFRLPIAAQLPSTFDEKGDMQASLSGTVREKGALTSLFPGLVQESRGMLDVDLKLTGTWQDPRFEGNARLSEAGGYLPTAGITVKNAGLSARFTNDLILIDSITASSGPGHWTGSATIRLKGGEVTGFEGRLDGDRFQTIYFPELQVQSSPKLTFSGTPKKITVRGEILLPVISILGTQSSQAVETSPDVVRVGKSKPAPQKLPFDLDARVNILLGDSVFFKAGAIDAQLGGNIDLQFQELDKIFGRGEIRVAKGRFETYGVSLEVVRGRLYYTGGPVNQPNLDILALKTVGDVKAGVTVTGRLNSPLIKLYSDPAMQEMDILAYIVLGHPLGSDTQQGDLLAVAAGALLSSRQAEGLQAQIQDKLGLSSLDISAGVVEKSGQMGYKAVKVAPTGTGASSESIGETMVMVGRYLTPKLYVSYGRSLFSGNNLFSLRYNLSKSWQVESQTGESSGVDIYYKLEFN